jgi:hypothetical protein
VYITEFFGDPDSKRLLTIRYITAYSAQNGVELEVLSACQEGQGPGGPGQTGGHTLSESKLHFLSTYMHMDIPTA